MTEGAVARRAVLTLELEPLDVLFFRDGRPFDAGPRATGGLPLPQTLAGAVRTWLFGRLGGDLGALAAAVRKGAAFADAVASQGFGPAVVGRLRIRGPWFARNGERLVPTPATIERDIDGRLHRLDPLTDELPGWSPAEMQGERPLWRRAGGPATPQAGYLCPTGLERFLNGGVPRPDEILDPEDLFAYEHRVGIGVDAATGTAGEGRIYSVRMMRLRPGISLAVDLVGTREDLEVCCPDAEDVLAIGGESRRAVVRRMSAGSWPAPVRAQTGGKLLLLTTPAPFGGWSPPGLPLVAAAVPGYVPVSGWDLARRGPKPNRFAVAAGSVYFLDRTTDLSDRDGSLCGGEDAAVGWGAYLEGVWSDA